MKIEPNSEESRDHSAPVSRPSRLVNLRMHDSDLIEEKPSTAPEPTAEIQSVSPAPAPATIPEPTVPAPIESALVPTVTETSESALMVSSNLETAIMDSRAAAASAAAAPVPTGPSIDEIAITASRAIANIRNATDPLTIASQIASLRQFADNLRNDKTMPEMLELAETIDKFIAVAEKSTAVKNERRKSALAAKADAAKRARAAKLAAEKRAQEESYARQSLVQPTATAKPATKASRSPLGFVHRTPKAAKAAPTKAPKSVKPATKTSATARLKNPLRSAARPAAPRSKAVNNEAALRSALRSVSNLERQADDVDDTPRISPARRGVGRRIALAFGCSILCVAGIIWAVAANIPDISVRVAAMQIGIESSYPSYIPQSFSLEDIDSTNGHITLTFRNSYGDYFNLIEEKSSWDSAALERNYVKPNWKDTYSTTHEQGITIYISGSSAAWVNGGVLYKINAANGVLTKKQLRNIVTSM